jgi:hypothetical protein
MDCMLIGTVLLTEQYSRVGKFYKEILLIKPELFVLLGGYTIGAILTG